MFLVFLIMAPPQKLVLAPGDTIKEKIRFRFLYEYNGSIVGGNLVQQVWLFTLQSNKHYLYQAVDPEKKYHLVSEHL